MRTLFVVLFAATTAVTLDLNGHTLDAAGHAYLPDNGDEPWEPEDDPPED
jgi:hypothetical protein